MATSFIREFLLKYLRNLRGLITVTSLLLAALSALVGTTIVAPWWVWIIVALVCALWISVDAHWKAYQDRISFIGPDTKIAEVVRRMVGTDKLFDENSSRTNSALLSIRECARLGQITVWGRTGVLDESKLELYPRAPIPAEYWDEFGIDYIGFLSNQAGETKRVRGKPREERVPNAVTSAIHVRAIPDDTYLDLWCCAQQIEKASPSPARPWRLAFHYGASPGTPGVRAQLDTKA